MAQPSWSTLEVDQAQFAPQVAYSTEKQLPYDKTGLEFHDKSRPIHTEARRFHGLQKKIVVIICSITLGLLVFVGVGVGVGLEISKPTADETHRSDPFSSTVASVPATSLTRITTTSLPTGFSSLASTPTGISLPTGTFKLAMSDPSYALNACVNNESQVDAWSCSVQDQSSYQMKVTGQIEGSYNLSLGTENATSKVLTYGLQEPVVNITGVTLGIDLNYPSRGPTYLFQALFNNIVIVPESMFSPANTKARALSSYGPLFIRKINIAQPGDSPWFCFWNATLLEVFIYANETSSSSSSIQTLPSYPKVVQVENSFEISTTNPYCTQYQISNDGSAVRLQSTSGSSPIYEINITSTSTTGCGCQWLVT
ncbi:hypothetical protein BCON_0849g00010 [Botryotinia convoluta]|uniref:DUF7820 domain-containing protein n=1 Tax=Botryotinia convoluta TaxID=54673 RepID=A0A4Z1H3J4_9HELO|nr:hypothetical protein BCON_0849g00010 [Botryotinia convoluta]